jgi:hypothetical protein
VYSSGAIVSPPANQFSQVFASAIINVAQDVKEPWPLVIVSPDGVARQITLLPGKMALIESSSTIQGFPYALQGKFMANKMVYFELVSPMDSDMVTVEDEIHIAAQNGDPVRLSRIWRTCKTRTAGHLYTRQLELEVLRPLISCCSMEPI